MFCNQTLIGVIYCTFYSDYMYLITLVAGYFADIVFHQSQSGTISKCILFSFALNKTAILMISISKKY